MSPTDPATPHAAPADPAPSVPPQAPAVLNPGADALDEVLRLADRAHAVDGHPPLNDQTRAVLGRGGQRWWGVTRSADGSLTGVAVLVPEGPADGPGVVELVVDPAHRRTGVGGALAAAAASAVARRSEEATTSAWAHGDLPGSAALARRHGLAPVRELRRMRLDAAGLAALPPASLPDGTRLRGFRVGRDEEAWLALNADAFADHPEQGSLTRADLEDRIAQDWFEADGLLLAEEADGTLLGYHWTKVTPTPGGDGAEGEVYAVGVSSRAQGRGLGRALTLAGLHHMAGRSVEAVDLYVDADNVPAVRLYDSLGFALAAADVQHRATGPEAGPTDGGVLSAAAGASSPVPYRGSAPSPLAASCRPHRRSTACPSTPTTAPRPGPRRTAAPEDPTPTCSRRA